MEAEGITITPKQREDVERQLRRTDLTRRVRERLEMVKAAALGDEVERIARWSGRSEAPWSGGWRALPRVGRRRAGDAPRSGRPVRADEAYLPAMETALETPPSRSAWPSTCGHRSDSRPIWSSRRGCTSRPAGCGCSCRSAAGCVDDPSTRSSTCRTPLPSPPRGRSWRWWGKKVRASRSATNCTSRTRRIWRPIRISAARGIARANNRRCRASGPIGASRCLAASKRWDARGWNWCAPRRTPPGSCAIWSCWRRITRRCSGRSIWCSIMARRIPAR